MPHFEQTLGEYICSRIENGLFSLVCYADEQRYSIILKRLENPQNDRGIFFGLTRRVLRSDAGIRNRMERSQAEKEPR